MDDLDRLKGYFKGGYRTRAERELEWNEAKLTSEIAAYLKEYHPTIPFTMDMSGEHLSKRAAVRSAANRAGNYKVPDCLIFVKKGKYGMLCLELKKLSAHPLKKDGKLKKSKHLEVQASSIKWLRAHGQKADFSVGFEMTVAKINEYLTDGDFVHLYK